MVQCWALHLYFFVILFLYIRLRIGPTLYHNKHFPVWYYMEYFKITDHSYIQANLKYVSFQDVYYFKSYQWIFYRNTINTAAKKKIVCSAKFITSNHYITFLRLQIKKKILGQIMKTAVFKLKSVILQLFFLK